MKIEAKKIRIEFNDSSEDYWEASCESGLELDEVIRMITRAWEEHGASAEPLIKDEKIRKAVRAWADVLEIDEVEFYGSETWIGFRAKNTGTGWSSKFELDYFGSENTLVPFRTYTIAELCGTPEPTEPTFIDLDERIKEKEEK